MMEKNKENKKKEKEEWASWRGIYATYGKRKMERKKKSLGYSIERFPRTRKRSNNSLLKF